MEDERVDNVGGVAKEYSETLVTGPFFSTWSYTRNLTVLSGDDLVYQTSLRQVYTPLPKY